MSWLHHFCDDLSSLHAYVSLLVSGQPVSRDAARQCRLPAERTQGFALEESGDVDGLLMTARENYQASLRQQSALAGRGTLLIVAGVLGVFLGGLWIASLAGPVWPRILFTVAALLLVNSVLLLLGLSSSEPDGSPGLVETEIALDPVNLKKSRINTYVVEQAKVVGRTQYLARLLAAARTFAVAGFLVLAGLVIARALTGRDADRASLAESIKNDPALAELLRGPRGERGEPGERGIAGLPGQPGKQGPPGERGADFASSKKTPEVVGEVIIVPPPSQTPITPQTITLPPPVRPIVPPTVPPTVPPPPEVKTK